MKEDYNEQFSTFTEETIMSMFEKSPELYSDFIAILKAANVSDMLSTYGPYTCFAPTNDAFKRYYEESGQTFETLSQEKIIELAYSHIISASLLSIDFPDGAISKSNFYDRFIYISYAPIGNELGIFANVNARLIGIDQKVHNGVVHTVDHVMEASRLYLPDLIAQEPMFSLFNEALLLTHMADSLFLYDDENYDNSPIYSDLYFEYWDVPETRKFGYTAFIESDSTYRAAGINNIEDMKRYAARVYDKLFPEDANRLDPTDRRNSLNRFVSYHLVNRHQAANEFINDNFMSRLTPGAILYDYIETMCPGTLIEVQTGNIFNKKKDGTYIGLLSVNHDAMNGVAHEIDKVLVYDEAVENDVLNKRIRMEVETMLPELNTNKQRFQKVLYVMIPPGYCNNMTMTDKTQSIFKLDTGIGVHLLTEILLGGKYDFTVRIPAVPPGSYEIRIGYWTYDRRGIAQVYFDNEPCGIPIDMRIAANSPKIGWKSDTSTEDNGVENDKMMHNRGYMKGSSVVYDGGSTPERKSSSYIRKILTRKTFYDRQPHYLRMKSVEEKTDREFQMDYIEFVPLSYLDKEDRE
jgi:uncharacterized surface protein with fasciclin (FAS1) repeats